MRRDAGNLRRVRQREGGFTLIELLVVVVVIGILIAIAIPVYLDYTKAAANKASESDLRHAITALEACYADNGSYPKGSKKGAPLSATALKGCTSEGIRLSAGTVLTYFPNAAKSASSYVLYAGNADGSNEYVCYASAVGGSLETEPTLPTKAQTSCP